MNVYELLKKDHREVKQLFKQIEETSSRAEKKRTELFEKLKKELIAHSKAEEKAFYSRLKKEDETKEDTLEAVEEHHVVDVLLKELSSMPVTSDEWMAKFSVLKENVMHHVKEEEEELFKEAKEVISGEEAEEVGEEVEKQKKKYLS